MPQQRHKLPSVERLEAAGRNRLRNRLRSCQRCNQAAFLGFQRKLDAHGFGGRERPGKLFGENLSRLGEVGFAKKRAHTKIHLGSGRLSPPLSQLRQLIERLVRNVAVLLPDHLDQARSNPVLHQPPHGVICDQVQRAAGDGQRQVLALREGLGCDRNRAGEGLGADVPIRDQTLRKRLATGMVFREYYGPLMEDEGRGQRGRAYDAQAIVPLPLEPNQRARHTRGRLQVRCCLTPRHTFDATIHLYSIFL